MFVCQFCRIPQLQIYLPNHGIGEVCLCIPSLSQTFGKCKNVGHDVEKLGFLRHERGGQIIPRAQSFWVGRRKAIFIAIID